MSSIIKNGWNNYHGISVESRGVFTNDNGGTYAGHWQYPMPDHSADVHFLDTKNNAGQRDSQAWGSLAAPLFALRDFPRFPSASAFMNQAYLPVLRRLSGRFQAP